jgi:hypothetical protein
MLAAISDSSGSLLPSDVQNHLYHAWLGYHASLIGCPSGDASKVGKLWSVPLTGGSISPTLLVGDGKFGSVLFPDLEASIQPLLGSLQWIGERYRWGLGTAQQLKYADGSCGLVESYEDSDAVVVPPSVLSVATYQAAEDEFPRVSIGSLKNGIRTYEVVLYAPDNGQPWGASAANILKIEYNTANGDARDSVDSATPGRSTCDAEIGNLASAAAGLESSAQAAHAALVAQEGS